MQEKNAVASIHPTSKSTKAVLWKKAIKWPLYSVAVMPVLIAAAWKINAGEVLRINQLVGFLTASILLLIWENLTNDLFDADTGVDEFKFHSVVALTGNKRLIRTLAYLVLLIGLILILILAFNSNTKVFFLVFGCCILGYLYQGPPFRLGYKGLGELLCFFAFGPLATAAALLVLSSKIESAATVPWKTAFTLGSGPALATTLVLFCSHFHQVVEDAANGKKTLLVRIGTKNAAGLIPWFILITLTLELLPIIHGDWPITTLLSYICLPSGIALINLLTKHHNNPSLISESKFLALRFQTLNGLGLSIGLIILPILLNWI